VQQTPDETRAPRRLAHASWDGLRPVQQQVCERFGVEWVEAAHGQKVGVAHNVRSDLVPLNGLRHPPEGDTTGWSLWAGEALSQDDDFFMPLHVEHLVDWCPTVLPYLGLPPGWRFLLAAGYEDVWYDGTLLDV
jgi:hypothetical protein